MARTLIGLERQIRRDPQRLPPAARAELLRVLLQPDFERAATIGQYWSNPETRSFADLLVECEENPYARAVLVGMLRDNGREGGGLDACTSSSPAATDVAPG